MARSRIPEMNWASENHEEALQLFKQTMSCYCEDGDITDPGKIALKILRGIGNEGLKRLNASGMSDADKKRPDKIWELFESQLKTNRNFRVHRLHLMDYSTSTPLNNVDQVGQACGRAHPPRACPAYKDSCKFCEKIGHWKKFCRKCKGTNRAKEDVQQRGNTKSDGKQHRDAILQDGQPVAFASKALNSAQSSYPNTDREMLAVVFGINRFHTYLYGRLFRVITDHKPLEMISKKPLLRAPPRLQRMLQKIQGYDFTIEYRQGKTMTLADTLSRLPNPKDKGTVELDLRVDGIEMTTAEVHRCDIDLVNFSQRKQHQLRDQTARDPTMNAPRMA